MASKEHWEEVKDLYGLDDGGLFDDVESDAEMENLYECLEKIFDLMGADYQEFESMSIEQRNAFVRELKIKDVLK